MTISCRNCVFFVPDVDRKKAGLSLVFGECHRYAPLLQLSRHTDNAAGIWPPVRAENWCGEHKLDRQGDLGLEAQSL